MIKMFEQLRVKTKLAILIAISLAGLLGYAALAYSTRQQVQIQGEFYRELVGVKAFLADVEPAVLFLGPGIRIASQLTYGASRTQLDTVVQEARSRRQRYEDAYARWSRDPSLTAEVRTSLEGSYRAAERFLDILENELIPAVRAGNRSAAVSIYEGKLHAAFTEHEEGVQRTIKLAKELFDATEARVARLVRERNTVQTIYLIGLVIVLVILGWILARSITGTLEQAAGTLSSTTVQIAAAVEQQERTAMGQSAAVNETTTTMDELDASFNQTAEVVRSAAEKARHSADVAEEGSAAVRQTLEGMLSLKEKVGGIAEQILSLSEQTSQISSITGLVTDLANQTNMLALNAAVEAARAGEHGRGFAVVAAEIRKLADESRKSAERINALVGDIQRSTNATVMATEEGTKTVEQSIQLTRKTVAAFEEVDQASRSASEAAEQTLLTVPQQVSAVRQVLTAMDSLNTGARETASGLGQTRDGIEGLREAAFRLKAAV